MPKLLKKPGKIFFGLLYFLSSIAVFYLIFWVWKPDIFELMNTEDSFPQISERLVFLSTVFIVPSILILKGKKLISIKFAAIVSGLWMFIFAIILSISNSTALGMANWVKTLTKPILFVTIVVMFFWSLVELLKAQEEKR